MDGRPQGRYFLRWVVDLPGAAMLVPLIAVFWLFLQGEGLPFTSDYRVYFDPDSDLLADFDEINAEFVRNEAVLFVVAPKQGDVFQAPVIQALRDLTVKVRSMPWAWQAYSLINVIDSGADGDELIVGPLVPEGELSPEVLDETRSRAMDNPRIRNGLLATDGRAAGVVVYFELPHENTLEENRTVADAAREIAQVLDSDQYDIHVTGGIPFNDAFRQSMERDVQTLYPAMYLLMAVLLVLLFRSIAATVGVLLLVSGAFFGGFGFANLMGMTLTPTSLASGTIIMTLAIADSVHVLASWYEAMRSGMRPDDAMERSLRINFRPIVLTSLTTAIGFLAANFGSSAPFADLGNIVAVGVLIALILSLTFLPAFMLLVSSPDPQQAGRRGAWTARALDGLADRVLGLGRSGWLLLAAVIVLILVGLPRNQFGDNYITFFDESIEFRRATEFADRNLTGMQLVEYIFRTETEGGVFDPQFLSGIQRFTDWLEQQPEVVRANSLVPLLTQMHRNMHGGEPEMEKLPDSQAMAAQYYYALEMSLPPGTDFLYLVNMDRSKLRVSVILHGIDSEQILGLEQRAQDWMAGNLPEHLRGRGTGLSVLFAEIARRNFGATMWGAVAAFAFISILFVAVSRSLAIGLVSLFTNLLPMLIGFALWGLFRGQVNLGLTIVTALTLGVVVDDSIHLLERYRRGRVQEGMDADGAVRYAIRSVGVPIIMTSVILVLGFALLTTSTFNLTADMGLLTLIVILAALFVDLVVLPPLLPLLDRK